jgi:hypothetical protein
MKKSAWESTSRTHPILQQSDLKRELTMKASCALLFLALPHVPLSAAVPVTLESLLNEMVDRSELTRLCEPPYVAKAATSYDRGSKVSNPEDGLYVEKNERDWGKGWFANRDFNQFIRAETINGRTEHVLMDDHGPGAIVRWWATANNDGIIRIYLDGAAEPVIKKSPPDWSEARGWRPSHSLSGRLTTIRGPVGEAMTSTFPFPTSRRFDQPS